MNLRETELPKHLVGHLSPQERQALQHPFRRHLLRALQEEGQRRSPAELVQQGKSPCPMACALHHMMILKNFGLLNEEGSEKDRGSSTHYFSASVDEGSPVLGVLMATEEADQHLVLAAS